MGFFRWQIPDGPYAYKWRGEDEPAPADNAVIVLYADDPAETYFRQVGDEWDTLVPQPPWIVSVEP